METESRLRPRLSRGRGRDQVSFELRDELDRQVWDAAKYLSGHLQVTNSSLVLEAIKEYVERHPEGKYDW